MTKFDDLIDNLKRDIQSLPSADGRECVPMADVPVLDRSVVVAPAPPSVCAPPAAKDRLVRGFVRHGMLTFEFFLFFVVLLSISRPSFLYRNERVVRNGREMWKTQFSTTHLLSYSAFFTVCIHVLMLIQKDFVKRY